MDVLTVNQFAVLLWKNFTLKRRKLINSILEIISALIFSVVLLIFHILTDIDILGPYDFTSQPISTLPSYIKNASEWELIYIPSDINVVKEITENVKRNLNISIKGLLLLSDMEKGKISSAFYWSTEDHRVARQDRLENSFSFS